jgi:SAM-dependent methyltransferase
VRRAGGLGREVAASVGASARLLPHLPELLADLNALGSSPRLVVAMLERAGAGRGARVLDLACGKGAVGIAVARGLSARVVGVDGFGAFLDAARGAATDAGVGALCEWVEGDVRRYRSRGDGFDVTMMLGLFGLEGAIPILCRHTRAGGLYVVDDATCEEGADAGLSRADARELIEVRGDTIIEVLRQTPSAARRQNAALFSRLRERARRLAREKPALAKDLRQFLDGQRRANRMLAGELRSTVWVVRRCGGRA